MRNINKLSPKIYLIFTVAVSFFAMVIYRATLFQCIFLSTYKESKVTFWVVWVISFVVTYLLTFRRRRNYLSVFSNAVLPLGIYSFMAYGDNNLIVSFAGMTIILLGGIYCFAVLVRPIKTDDMLKGAIILRNRFLNSINGTRTIAAVCVLGMFVSLLSFNAFDLPVFVPSVKPSVSVAEDKTEVLEESMPVISKIDDDIWVTLTFEDRLDVLQTLANVDASQQGVSHEINLCAEYLGSSTYGTYDYSTHTVTINAAVVEWDTSAQSVNTVMHEVRHAYQHDLTDAYLSLDKDYQQLLAFDDVRKYYENIEYYQSAEKYGFDQYENQTIEVDSREYAEAKSAFYFRLVDKYITEAA